jgi:hypothetical protein
VDNFLGTFCETESIADQDVSITVVISVDDYESESAVAEYLLLLLLQENPGSVDAQYYVNVSIGLDADSNEIYNIEIIIFSTKDAEAADIADALENSEEFAATGFIIQSVEANGANDDDTTAIVPAEESPMVLYLLGVLTAFCVMGCAVLSIRAKTNKKRQKRIYSMPM